jgi:hypothetical protein
MRMSVSMNAMTERGIAHEEQSSRRRDSTESVNGLKVGICVFEVNHVAFRKRAAPIESSLTETQTFTWIA